MFGGLGRGGDRKKGCLSCVSEKQPFFREVVEQAPERNCENTERFFHMYFSSKGQRGRSGTGVPSSAVSGKEKGSKGMTKNDTTKKEERKTITRADIMERMRECWEKLRFDRKLTKQEENMVDYNFSLIRLYIELHPRVNDGEHTFACGFEYSEDEEDESEYEDED